ncbi:MAG: RsmE family RNA methyltransferase [Planctomycetota bacterium]|nr:RsmE family RNA methyltransferase [Planctomycetota bacterium]
MNIVLLKDTDFVSETKARLTGRVANHVSKVLKSTPGTSIKIGRLNGPLGRGVVERLDSGVLELRCEFDPEAPPRSSTKLVIALPRPQTLKKVLFEGTTLGVEHFVFVKAARTEKSYLQTKVLKNENYREYLHLGLEQCVDTWEPKVTVLESFKALMRFFKDGFADTSLKILADPHGQCRLDRIRPRCRPVAFAIGPEGGWLPFECEQLVDMGFERVTLGRRILRVETATTALLSQLSVLREIS